MAALRNTAFAPQPQLMRIVGDRKATLGEAGAETNSNNNSRQAYYIRFAPADTAIAFPSIVLPTWMAVGLLADIGSEKDLPYAWDLSYSLEYPSGTITQVTWLGSRTVRVTPGIQNVWSDPVAVVIPAGAQYNLREWATAATLRVPVATVDVVGGALTNVQISDAGTGLNTTDTNTAQTSTPALSCAVPAGAGAGAGGALAPVVTSGALASITVTAGSGYTNGLAYPIVFANGMNDPSGGGKTSAEKVNHAANLPDLTLTAGLPTQVSLLSTAPVAIMGRQVTPSPSVAALTDSILDGSNDTADVTGRTGCWEKSIRNNHGWTSIGRGGADIAHYLMRHSREYVLNGQITHLVQGLIRNDVFGGAVPLGTLQTNSQNLWNTYLSRGVKVFQITCLPSSTSTDFWATTINQTALSGSAVEISYNAWLRANATSLGITVIDLSTVMESAIGSGLFAAGPNSGSQGRPNLVISGGVVTAATVVGVGANYPNSTTVACDVFYATGVPGSGLTLHATTNGSGQIASFVVDTGGSAHDANNPPFAAPQGSYTNDGIHPSVWGHLKIAAAGLFAPSLFTL